MMAQSKAMLDALEGASLARQMGNATLEQDFLRKYHTLTGQLESYVAPIPPKDPGMLKALAFGNTAELNKLVSGGQTLAADVREAGGTLGTRFGPQQQYREMAPAGESVRQDARQRLADAQEMGTNLREAGRGTEAALGGTLPALGLVSGAPTATLYGALHPEMDTLATAGAAGAGSALVRSMTGFGGQVVRNPTPATRLRNSPAVRLRETAAETGMPVLEGIGNRLANFETRLAENPLSSGAVAKRYRESTDIATEAALGFLEGKLGTQFSLRGTATTPVRTQIKEASDKLYEDLRQQYGNQRIPTYTTTDSLPMRVNAFLNQYQLMPEAVQNVARKVASRTGDAGEMDISDYLSLTKEIGDRAYGARKKANVSRMLYELRDVVDGWADDQLGTANPISRARDAYHWSKLTQETIGDSGKVLPTKLVRVLDRAGKLDAPGPPANDMVAVGRFFREHSHATPAEQTFGSAMIGPLRTTLGTAMTGLGATAVASSDDNSVTSDLGKTALALGLTGIISPHAYRRFATPSQPQVKLRERLALPRVAGNAAVIGARNPDEAREAYEEARAALQAQLEDIYGR